jgi:hypothetical protein
MDSDISCNILFWLAFDNADIEKQIYLYKYWRCILMLLSMRSWRCILLLLSMRS